MSTVTTDFTSVRTLLREWVEEQIHSEGGYSVSDLITRAELQFTGDEEFTGALLRDGLAVLVPLVANEVTTNDAAFVRTASGSVNREGLEARSKEMMARIFLSLGDGRKVSLLSLTKPELRTAIDLRRPAWDTEGKTLDALEEIYSGLPNSKITVGECLSEDRLAQIWKKHFNA